MKLREIYDANPNIKEATDKDTYHSYLDYYEGALQDYQESATKVVEIGVFRGGSMELWCNYFTKATIYGFDTELFVKAGTYGNVKLFQEDAYSSDAVDRFAIESLDVVIDDGPHTLQSQILAIVLYFPKLKPGGSLFIEDIQSEDDLNFLTNLASRFTNLISIFDARHAKGRYDDLIIRIQKGH